MNSIISRRAFVTGAAVLASCVAVPASGCSAKNESSWTWRQDDDLPVLATEVAGGSQVAMPGDGWKRQGDWIQLQLAGASIPGEVIAAIVQNGDTLVVELEQSSSDIETMDMLLTEYRVTGGDASSVQRVAIKQGRDGWDAQEGV